MTRGWTFVGWPKTPPSGAKPGPGINYLSWCSSCRATRRAWSGSGGSFRPCTIHEHRRHRSRAEPLRSQRNRGKALLFDDTFNHEVWNVTDDYRVGLLVDSARPPKHPWHSLNERFLSIGTFAPFLREAGKKKAAGQKDSLQTVRQRDESRLKWQLPQRGKGAKRSGTRDASQSSVIHQAGEWPIRQKALRLCAFALI